MPRFQGARRPGRARIKSWRQTLDGIRNRTGMYVPQPRVDLVLAYLSGSTGRETLWRDEFREWLAHGFDLDGEYSWEALALHVVSRARTRVRKVRWSPDLTLRVVRLATYKEAMRKLGRSHAAQLCAIRRLCDLMTTCLDWRLKVSPDEWGRFEKGFLRVGPPS